MEESISGFKDQGGWNDIVEHGERITHALAELGIDGDAFSEWDEWRPKSRERLDEDVNEKTADQASISESESEQAGVSPNDDLKSAGESLDNDLESAGEHVARAADLAGRKAIRTVEGTVYKNVMTQVAPYYFDNDLVSANLQRTGSAREGEYAGYVFEINVNDDDLKERVSERLAEYEDEVDRWHVDTEKRTEALETVEGGEVDESDLNVDSTTN